MSLFHKHNFVKNVDCIFCEGCGKFKDIPHTHKYKLIHQKETITCFSLQCEICGDMENHYTE